MAWSQVATAQRLNPLEHLSKLTRERQDTDTEGKIIAWTERSDWTLRTMSIIVAGGGGESEDSANQRANPGTNEQCFCAVFHFFSSPLLRDAGSRNNRLTRVETRLDCECAWITGSVMRLLTALT